MVALCLQHHIEADRRAFSVAQLRALKVAPFLLRAGGAPIGHFNWRREQLILHVGAGFCIRCPVFLRIAGRDVIWVAPGSDGSELLNLDLWDATGNLIFSMRANDWLAYKPFEDLEAPPSARSLTLRAPNTGVLLDLQFSTATVPELQAIVEADLKAAGETAAGELRRQGLRFYGLGTWISE